MERFHVLRWNLSNITNKKGEESRQIKLLYSVWNNSWASWNGSHIWKRDIFYQWWPARSTCFRKLVVSLVVEPPITKHLESIFSQMVGQKYLIIQGLVNVPMFHITQILRIFHLQQMRFQVMWFTNPQARHLPNLSYPMNPFPIPSGELT